VDHLACHQIISPPPTLCEIDVRRVEISPNPTPMFSLIGILALFMPKSERLKRRDLEERQRQIALTESDRQLARQGPRKCTQCKRQARSKCLLCRVCFARRQDDAQQLILCQGCPRLVRGAESIKWAERFPDLARWLSEHMQVSVQKGSRNGPATRLILEGWRNGYGVEVLDNRITSSTWLIIATLQPTFALLGIKLDQSANFKEIVEAINKATIDWCVREWGKLAGREILPLNSLLVFVELAIALMLLLCLYIARVAAVGDFELLLAHQL